METNLIIISVWSSYGHRFMESEPLDDDPESGSYEKCMTCGAMFRLVPELTDEDRTAIAAGEPYIQVRGNYITSDGDDPEECTGRCDLFHHYEGVCEADNGEGCPESLTWGDCEHSAIKHGCNCVICTG